jgi:hypothetical protein
MVAPENKNGSAAGSSSSGKWMIMCYIAGDNTLSPLFIDQLKAIKNAGFAQDVEVLVYFDPNEIGVPTLIFDVNNKRKKKNPKRNFQFGDDPGSSVGDMVDDIVKLGNDETAAADSLKLFLEYCLDRPERADHYMLYLLGHGMVVGNDAFLPDDFPQSGIKLTQLGEILNHWFGPDKNRSLELIGMHCCAMNAIEVLYELQGVAKYMIGSEGLAFVGGWPYRQLLRRFFEGLENNETIETLVETLYRWTVLNSKDFSVAGYPLELSLCSLDRERVNGLTESLKALVRRLMDGLYDEDEEATDAIQLAHLKSQSYFDERYTDLYDFCFCLARQCGTEKLPALRNACLEVAKKLEPIREPNDVMKRFEALVIQSEHFGWSSQYSHGVSIFFPWSEPTRKSPTKVMDEYQEYKFTRALGSDSWLRFLEYYFTRTKRKSRQEEDAAPGLAQKPPGRASIAGIELGDAQMRAWQGALEKVTGGSGKVTGGAEKVTGGSSTSCDCPSLKNYPRNVL